MPEPVPVDERFEERRSYLGFLLSLALVALACFAGVFLAFAIRSRDLIREETLNRARADFSNIVLVRRWNASYGGIWVEKRPGVQSNPYLKNPDMQGVDGKVYTQKNHALMTREISEIASRSDGLKFHITSLRPLNPGNRPDERERQALLAFKEGEKERSWDEQIGGRRRFRYMAPLVVEESCLACHAEQGYKLGDIRGGISVSFDVEAIIRKLHRSTVVIAVAGVLVYLILMVPVVLLVRRLRVRLSELWRGLQLAAVTDGLTGLFNRRHLFERFEEELQRHRRQGRSLGCVILDIDHFKAINDDYGHLAGDEVLRSCAAAVRQAGRPYDMVGRYGGDEFVVVLPEVDLTTAVGIGERLRQQAERSVSVSSSERGARAVTVSVGVTCSRAEDESVDALLARADGALYRAKDAGRDRVEAIE